VNRHKVWIGNLIYWTLNCHTKTNVLSHSLHCAAWYHLPKVDIPLLPGSHSCRLVAIPHKPPTILTAISRLSRVGNWSSLYGHTQNSASISSSAVGWHWYLCGLQRKQCSSVACANVVMLMSCLLCCNTVMALSSVTVSQYAFYSWSVWCNGCFITISFICNVWNLCVFSSSYSEQLVT
jgi:hypothetical protein